MNSFHDTTVGVVHGSSFVTTQWSIIHRAGAPDQSGHTQASNQLCRQYWGAVYGYIRRQGRNPEDAQDLTQGFLMQLLTKGRLGTLSPHRGRFRNYLLTAARNYLANHWRFAHRSKRGGLHAHVALDEHPEVESLAVTSAKSELPSGQIDRKWIVEATTSAFQEIRAHYIQLGQLPLFEALQPCLWQEKGHRDYKAIGQEFGFSETATKSVAHRIRQRLKRALQERVAAALKVPPNHPSVDEELRQWISNP
jgi:RNA polymerase sigma factor (sigma-70 family)